MEEESTELPGSDGLAPKQRHQAKQRELFLSRHVETLPATHIRGKCTVTLLNETESLLSYLNKDVSMYVDLGGQRPHTYWQGRPGGGLGLGPVSSLVLFVLYIILFFSFVHKKDFILIF